MECFTLCFNTTSKNERKNYNIINQNRKNCKGTIELQIGEKVYNIERKSEKYVKRLKGVETNEARTFLDFTQDEDLSLNGTTRNETDANIRKQFWNNRRLFYLPLWRVSWIHYPLLRKAQQSAKRFLRSS